MFNIDVDREEITEFQINTKTMSYITNFISFSQGTVIARLSWDGIGKFKCGLDHKYMGSV